MPYPCNRVEHFAARLRIARQKPEEAERLRGQSRQHGGDRHGACAGDHGAGKPLAVTRIDEHRPGIGDARHARVGHIGDLPAAFQRFDDLLGAFALVVRMQRARRLLNAEVLQQQSGMAGVLAIDAVDRAERFDRTRGEVAEVSDGRCDKIQHQRTLVRRLSPFRSTIAVSAPSIMRLATRSP